MTMFRAESRLPAHLSPDAVVLLRSLLLCQLADHADRAAECRATVAELTGQPEKARYTSPWLRSMRGEREEDMRRSRGITGVERIVVISVVAAFLAFEIWFFFFAGSSLPNA